MSGRRRLGVVGFALLLWVALNLWAVTRTPPPPVICFDIAGWDGKRFVPTGEWKCLK